MEKIVIIGGGFAGLNLVKRLDPEKYRISLVIAQFPLLPLFLSDRLFRACQREHMFPVPTRNQKMKNVSYHMGHVKQIDIAAKESHHKL